MRIVTSGWTRVVILTKTKAFKIARLRFELPSLIRIAIKSSLDRKWFKERIQERLADGANVRALISKEARRHFDMVSGLKANRQEMALFQEHPELALAPVLGMYLGGLVLVMVRGEEVSPEESEEFRKPFPDGDFRHPWHVCKFSDGLRLIDYGSPDARAALGI